MSQDFSGKLQALMTARNISQAELFRVSGVPQPTISAYIRRANKPSWEHVQSLARALGVTCADLTDDINQSPTLSPDSRPMGKRK